MVAQKGLAVLESRGLQFRNSALASRRSAFLSQVPFGELRPAPYRAPYRPAMLSNSTQAQLGQREFSIGELPQSLAFGFAGAGAFVLSGIMPSPIKEIATISGFALLGWGILSLFPAPETAVKSGEEAAGVPFKTATSDEFALVTAKVTRPSASESVSRNLWSQSYNIEVLWENGSDKAISMPYSIFVEETPEPGLLSYGLMPFKGVVHTGVVKLAPGASVTIPMTISLKSEGINIGGALGLKVVVQKISASREIVNAAQRFFVVY
jgi:hypothetical protein